jgi:hypothetical protein
MAVRSSFIQRTVLLSRVIVDTNLVMIDDFTGADRKVITSEADAP